MLLQVNQSLGVDATRNELAVSSSTTVLVAPTPTPRSAELTAAEIRWKEEFGALRDIVVQLAELRGEGAWKEMRYDLEVACAELRVAENKLVEVSLPPRLWAVSSPRHRRGL